MKNNMSPTVIKNKIKALGRDGVFVAADFYGIAGRDAIRKTLSRLEEDNYIKRVMRGVYYKTRYSKLLKEDVIPSPRLVASAIARNNGWTIAPSGIMALNMTGLSTQVPAQLSYVTNGTPKTYHYDNFTIIFKRTSARDLERLSKKTAIVVQALKAIGKDKVTPKDLNQIRRYLSPEEKNKAVKEARYATSWIYDLIKML
jgi:Predicted transcriptional regulator